MQASSEKHHRGTSPLLVNQYLHHGFTAWMGACGRLNASKKAFGEKCAVFSLFCKPLVLHEGLKLLWRIGHSQFFSCFQKSLGERECWVVIQVMQWRNKGKTKRLGDNTTKDHLRMQMAKPEPMQGCPSLLLRPALQLAVCRAELWVCAVFSGIYPLSLVLDFRSSPSGTEIISLFDILWEWVCVCKALNLCSSAREFWEVLLLGTAALGLCLLPAGNGLNLELVHPPLSSVWVTTIGCLRLELGMCIYTYIWIHMHKK